MSETQSTTQKAFGAVARLFRPQPKNSLVSTLHAKAFGQPLFAHPDMGGQILRGYLSASQQDGKPSEHRSISHKEHGIAIINVTGALVAHDIIVPCEESPVSYERIKAELIDAIDDSSIEAIVIRLDTPGGEAAQNCDLSDFIFEQRGKKPIIGCVDDAAYSAGFAIASACDQIWITRTGGVGSVGVVSYHLDQSEFNKKVGVKIEFIHAGQRKVDGHPHAPLTDEARDRFQAEVTRLYDLFCETVARNLGMSVEAVKATEATTYHGQQAIDAGFAHKLGTFDDVIDALLSDQNMIDPTGTTMPEEKQENTSKSASASEPAPTAESDEAAKPSEQSATSDIDAAAAMLEPENSPGLAKTENQDSQPDQQQNTQKAKSDAAIRAACTAAGVPDLAKDYIASGQTPDEVREELRELLQAGEVEVQASQKVAVSEQSVSNAASITTSEIYAARRQQ